MARPLRARRLLVTLAALIAALSAAGCVSMPTGGPVQSYPMTQGTNAPNQQYVQIQPQPPGPGWNPAQIVQGFLIASASFGNYGDVVLQYLTPQERKNWNTYWSAVVYKTGPNVTAPTYPTTEKGATRASVGITGKIQASLKGSGSYSVPSSSAQANSTYVPDFQLQKVSGQWRISFAPQELLLTSNSFQNDYQLRDLYFFDPMTRYLVPDPVYVPLVAKPEDLMHELVQDLIAPPADWLSQGATKTAFPQGTKIVSVGLDGGGTAIVDLTGTITKATGRTMQQVSAQLLSTLSGAVQGGPNGQTVKSVEVLLDGKPWGSGNPVQTKLSYQPAYGASAKFYYVDSGGYLNSSPAAGGPPRRLAKIGTGYSQIAVSPDGKYVAALQGNALYGGTVGGPLVKRGAGYVAISWDVDDDLWASTGDRIVMFHGTAGAQQPLGQMVPVTVVPNFNLVEPPYTSIKVAPDGVRVAIVQDGTLLTFGAISGQRGPNPQISLSTVQESPQSGPAPAPANAVFTALSWYGPSEVIALATPGPAVAQYLVSGGTPVPIPTDPGMKTIASSYGQPLVAGLTTKQMVTDASLAGSWTSINNGDTPAAGSLPVYPG